MAVATLTAADRADPRRLVDGQVLTHLNRRLALQEGLVTATASLVVQQTLGFLVACALNPERRLFPSAPVSAGWQEFVLYTQPYAKFCDQFGGRFLHHQPIDGPEDDPDDWEKALAITMQAMRTERLPVLPRMWEVPDVWPLTGLSCRPLPLLPQESRP